MDLSKSLEFFDPELLNGRRVHIIGCGSVGSTIAELLARFGVEDISLYDMDVVEAKNIHNQMFFRRQVGNKKVDALAELLALVNPDITTHLETFDEGYTDQPLSGYVFLCLDNVDTRRQIATANRYNKSIELMMDCRTGFLDATHYGVDWQNSDAVSSFLKTMNFTHEQAAKATPVSACGVTLGVVPTVRAICNVAVVNFLLYLRGDKLTKMAMLNPFSLTDAYGTFA